MRGRKDYFSANWFYHCPSSGTTSTDQVEDGGRIPSCGHCGRQECPPYTIFSCGPPVSWVLNVMGNAQGAIGRVCRWHDTTNLVALLRAQGGFRRIRGHAQQQLGELRAALGRPQAA